MKTFTATLALLFLLVFYVPAIAQNPQAAPTPTPDNRDVVRISTNLIQLDVTVTDKKGKVITDLRSDEIEIFENGKRQDVSNFSFISSVKQALEKPVKKNSDSGTAVAPRLAVQPKAENIRRTIAIVVDDLTLSFASSYWVKTALKKYVQEQVQDGDLVAIVRTGGGVGVLQQFTTDKRQLLAAAEKTRYNMAGTGGIGAVDPIRPWVDNFESEVNEFRESVFVNGSISAINQIVGGMRELPGRKSVVLLSDGFQLFKRGVDRKGPSNDVVLDSLKRLTDLANRSSVVIYTIDAKGLVAPGLTGEDNTFDMDSDAVSQLLIDRQNETAGQQEGLQYLAQSTGGFAVVNSNNINSGISRILDDQSYYLIGYQPDGDTFDAKKRRYNQLEVKVKREGANVRYRSGFFGVDDKQTAKPQLAGNQTILNAITSPFATNDIPLRLNALFVADEKKTLNVQTYLHVDASDLTFTKESDGTYKTDFDLVGVAFGQGGTSVDEFAKRYKLTLKESAYQSIQKKGFVYNFAFPIKKHGAYQVRVVIYDAATKKVGSASQFLEIPKLHSDRLALSGLVFETMPLNILRKVASGTTEFKDRNPHLDTSLRRFSRGTLVQYGYGIYRGKDIASKPANLTQHIRVFQEDKLIYESQPTAIPATATSTITATGSFELGEKMPPGDYIVQIVVTDNQAKGKHKFATQAAQFEVVEQ